MFPAAKPIYYRIKNKDRSVEKTSKK